MAKRLVWEIMFCGPCWTSCRMAQEGGHRKQSARGNVGNPERLLARVGWCLASVLSVKVWDGVREHSVRMSPVYVAI